MTLSNVSRSTAGAPSTHATRARMCRLTVALSARGYRVKLLQRLATALATQRAFIADAAHTLRTPLTTVHLQTQNPLYRGYSENWKKYLTR